MMRGRDQLLTDVGQNSLSSCLGALLLSPPRQFFLCTDLKYHCISNLIVGTDFLILRKYQHSLASGQGLVIALNEFKSILKSAIADLWRTAHNHSPRHKPGTTLRFQINELPRALTK